MTALVVRASQGHHGGIPHLPHQIVVDRRDEAWDRTLVVPRPSD